MGRGYGLVERRSWETVRRGGVGVFYDLATSEAGSNIPFAAYPFGSFVGNFGSSFPLNPAMAQPGPITPANLSSGLLNAYDPNLKLPYTLEWNAALEQALGTRQALSVSYIGSVGRRLLQTAFIFVPNPNILEAQLVTNAGTSDYAALQVQFQRRLSHGLQVLASYTWSHSIDTGSAGSAFGNFANALAPSLSPNANRGASDFDIRNAFTPC